MTFNSTSWVIILFGVKQEWTLWCIPSLFFNLILLIISGLMSFISLLLANIIENDNLSNVDDFTLANHSFIPTYLGYFFVGLSLENINQFIFAYIIIFIFVYLSQTEYFNPIYLLFRYKFYYVLTSKKIRIFIITRRKIKDLNDKPFDKLKRINDTTFIDLGDVK